MFSFLSIFQDTHIKVSITIISIYGMRGRNPIWRMIPVNDVIVRSMLLLKIVYVLANLSDT